MLDMVQKLKRVSRKMPSLYVVQYELTETVSWRSEIGDGPG